MKNAILILEEDLKDINDKFERTLYISTNKLAMRQDRQEQLFGSQPTLRHRQQLVVRQQHNPDIHLVEKSIMEIGQMFHVVSNLVDDQQTSIDDIKSNVIVSEELTNVAQNELLTLFNFISSERFMILRLLFVILVIGMFIIYWWT